MHVEPPRLGRHAYDKADSGPKSMADGYQIPPDRHIVFSPHADVPTAITWSQFVPTNKSNVLKAIVCDKSVSPSIGDAGN